MKQVPGKGNHNKQHAGFDISHADETDKAPTWFLKRAMAVCKHQKWLITLCAGLRLFLVQLACELCLTFCALPPPMLKVVTR